MRERTVNSQGTGKNPVYTRFDQTIARGSFRGQCTRRMFRLTPSDVHARSVFFGDPPSRSAHTVSFLHACVRNDTHTLTRRARRIHGGSSGASYRSPWIERRDKTRKLTVISLHLFTLAPADNLRERRAVFNIMQSREGGCFPPPLHLARRS